MSELFVMRRANGDLFTQEINGKLVIPVWSGRDAVARYKERNPAAHDLFARAVGPLYNEESNERARNGRDDAVFSSLRRRAGRLP